MTDIERIRKTKLKDLPYINDDYLTRKQVKDLAIAILIGLVISLICFLPITYIVANADSMDESYLRAIEAIGK